MNFKKANTEEEFRDNLLSMTILEKFLKENNCWEIFKNNYERQNDYKINEYFNNFGENSTSIFNAFDWAMTPEGGKYWAKLNNQFEGYEFQKNKYRK